MGAPRREKVRIGQRQSEAAFGRPTKNVAIAEEHFVPDAMLAFRHVASDFRRSKRDSSAVRAAHCTGPAFTLARILVANGIGIRIGGGIGIGALSTQLPSRRADTL